MVFGAYPPVRSVPFRRGMAYVTTNRVLWAPSAPGRRLVDEREFRNVVARIPVAPEGRGDEKDRVQCGLQDGRSTDKKKRLSDKQQAKRKWTGGCPGRRGF